MVEIVLLERVEKLGQIGDVVNVKPGYARNFLFPRAKALRATKSNIAMFEERKAQILAENLKLKAEAESIAKKMDGLSVIVIRQAGESGQLYGSVSSRDISEAVTAKGFTVNRNQVHIAHPIKNLGITNVHVILHPEVKVVVAINIAQSEEEAHMQAEKAKPAPAKKAEAAAADETTQQQA
jgi:large subunit ribosomal protein L9